MHCFASLSSYGPRSSSQVSIFSAETSGPYFYNLVIINDKLCSEKLHYLQPFMIGYIFKAMHRDLEHLETKVKSGSSQEGLASWPNNSALDENFLKHHTNHYQKISGKIFLLRGKNFCFG